MILLINICKEKLHFNEFVKPVGDVLVRNGIKGFIRHYTCLTKKDLDKASKVIICGTSLKDFGFIDDVDKFSWLKDFDKPVLGICGGMQIIGLVFDGESLSHPPSRNDASHRIFDKLKKKKEIGYYSEKFSKEFLGMEDEREVYHLHNGYVDFSKTSDFEVFCRGNGIDQAVKHKKKNIFGVLFHPEVRQKEMILEFVNKK